MPDLQAHIAIGTAALARGLITVREFADAMLTLAASQETSTEEVWVKSGRLSSEQLEEFAPSGIARVEPRRADRSVMQQSGTVTFSQPIIAEKDSELVNSTKPVLHSLRTPAQVEEHSPSERYVAVRVLGTGGMGEVVECTDTLLARRVALKSVRKKYDRDSEHARMLEKEARLTGSLEHPNIIPVYDFGKSESLGPYYVMRRVEQSTLADALERLRGNQPDALATYTLGRLLRWFIQVCEAVEYAHNRGIIHRDLKPANILLGSFGEVLVADWGFAHRLEERTAYRGGTYGYSAPEQFELVPTGLDARADVFALGSILYEIATLKPAFSDDYEGATRAANHFGWRGYQPAKPPQELAGDRVVPPDIAEVCLKALSLNRDHRFSSAREMARAIEAFLEGTKEKERRQARAEELVADAALFAEHFHDYVENRPTHQADLVELRNSSTAWDAAARRRALWDAEDRLSVTDALAIRTLHAAVSSYEQALDEVPGHTAARRGLARLYWAEMQRAEDRRDEFDRIYAEELVRQYDDGLITEELGKGGFLEVEVLAADGALKRPLLLLETLARQERRLVASRIELLGGVPCLRREVPRGSHVVLIRREGLPDVRCPIFVRGGQDVKVVVNLEHTNDLAPGEIFVPGGEALFADEEAFSSWGALRKVEVAPFVILDKPVSFGEYLEFLTHVMRERPQEAEDLIPRGRDGAPYFKWKGDTFEPKKVAELGDVGRMELVPALGVSARNAEAFAAWKSSVTGRHYRLPGEDEWEKAARGVDGRRYPWGDHFDPSFCHMRDSRQGQASPEPSGSFPFDVSVYGVRDLAGGIAEWVISAHEVHESEAGRRHVVARGGAWCDWAAECTLSARRRYLAVERAPRVGFRLARSTG